MGYLQPDPYSQPEDFGLKIVGMAKGDTVRIKGMVGARFKILGFRGDDAELFGGKQGRSPAYRTIPAERLIKVRAGLDDRG